MMRAAEQHEEDRREVRERATAVVRSQRRSSRAWSVDLLARSLSAAVLCGPERVQISTFFRWAAAEKTTKRLASHGSHDPPPVDIRNVNAPVDSWMPQPSFRVRR